MSSIHQRIGISARIDPIAYQYAKTKPNLSRYIEALIIHDMQIEKKEAIYEAITSRMLKDPEFIAQFTQQLKRSGPVVHKIDKEVTVVEGDWGAW